MQINPEAELPKRIFSVGESPRLLPPPLAILLNQKLYTEEFEIYCSNLKSEEKKPKLKKYMFFFLLREGKS